VVEVILKEPVENLGRAGEVVKVADGYARNYLLPRKLAMPVTEGNRRQIEHLRKRAAEREAQDVTVANTLAARIGQTELAFARRVGDTEQLYGSVTSVDIAEALHRQQIDVDRRKIQLADPIKQLGEFTVPIKLHREVTAEVKVVVVKDEP
jgi:large subunit ribosomal protein L9